MTFEIHSRKTDVIARVRQYARQNQYFFKLPIEFKKSVLFREPNIQGHLNLQTCFSADPKSSVVWIEVKATDAGNLFTSSVQKFDNAQYLVTALEKIFPGEKLEPKSTTRGNKTCQELERIQWPNNIF